MEPDEVAELFDREVASARTAVQPDGVVQPDDDGGTWGRLFEAAADGPAAVRLARARLLADDPAVRALACDLLGLAAERHVEVRGAAATTLITLAATESDGSVRWSIARALGGTHDTRAVPVLVALAGHEHAEVRIEAATSLPAVMGDDPDDIGTAALIALSADPDPGVRNWATFSLSWLCTADGSRVREALGERADDTDPEVREEGIGGLARRRDPRALPLVAELLAGDNVLSTTFDAAAFLADPSLLPLLADYDASNPRVARALLECDPVRRTRRDLAAARLYDAVCALRPDAQVALLAERYELGLLLEVTDRPAAAPPLHWSVEALLERAGGDPERAAQLVAVDLTA